MSAEESRGNNYLQQWRRRWIKDMEHGHPGFFMFKGIRFCKGLNNDHSHGPRFIV